jgi:hypothetical protein
LNTKKNKNATRTTLTAKRKMILTNCAACAAPLAHDAPRCIRCKTRYCDATCQDPAATPDDLREAVTTLEDVLPTARRVLGGAHPDVAVFEKSMQNARAALAARETPPPSSPSGDV